MDGWVRENRNKGTRDEQRERTVDAGKSRAVRHG